MGIAELKEACLCEGDRGWLCLTAQAAFLLVTDTGKKTSFSSVAPPSSGLLLLELPGVSGRHNRIECICSPPSNSSRGVLGKIVLGEISGVACLRLIMRKS